MENHLILATADHGILWRMETEFNVLNDDEYEHTDRRHLTGAGTQRPFPPKRGVSEGYDGTQYYRLHHQYLFHDLRSNEPGVHGGYSCKECIIPLINIRDNRY